MTSLDHHTITYKTRFMHDKAKLKQSVQNEVIKQILYLKKTKKLTSIMFISLNSIKDTKYHTQLKTDTNVGNSTIHIRKYVNTYTFAFFSSTVSFIIELHTTKL